MQNVEEEEEDDDDDDDDVEESPRQKPPSAEGLSLIVGDPPPPVKVLHRVRVVSTSKKIFSVHYSERLGLSPLNKPTIEIDRAKSVFLVRVGGKWPRTGVEYLLEEIFDFMASRIAVVVYLACHVIISTIHAHRNISYTGAIEDHKKSKKCRKHRPITANK